MSTVEMRSVEDAVAMPAQDPRERGREEVRLCRRNVSRRLTTRLGELTAGPGWRAAVRLATVRFQGATRPVLAVLGWFGSAIGRLPFGRKVGAGITRAGHSFEFFSGAIEEAGGWQAFRREFAMRLPVLCYHHVGERMPHSWSLLTVSPRVFRRQIEWLATCGYTGIHAADWLAWVQQGRPLPEKPVLVTFDDGYSDLLKNAIPTLETYGFKATIFIVSQHLGGASTWDEALGYPSRPIMTAKQVQECPSHGIEIGAHSRTHPDLRRLGDAELKTELEGCREELTELMGRGINTFAYCFGRQNDNVRMHAGAAYALAFSCKPGFNAWRTDPYCLRRMFVHPSRINFALQVKYGVDLVAVYCFARDRMAKIWRRVLPLPAHSKHLASPTAGTKTVAGGNS